MNRPEHLKPPELFYDDAEAKKYTYNSRIIDIQDHMCERAIELLLLPKDKTCLLLDIGCGSGLSGNVIESYGHHWIGVDISMAMLKIAINRQIKGDLILSDMGQGISFKAAAFDGAISISALQWLCNVDRIEHKFHKRLNMFFKSLYACLASNARAVFQFYPENDEQLNAITLAAAKAGFFGGTVIDYPNSKKAKKFFLILMTSGSMDLPKELKVQIENSKKFTMKRHVHKKKRIKKNEALTKFKSNWILKKKVKLQQKGRIVKSNSKYTGRRRKTQL